ncbi:MAG: hypothetical protein K0S38_834, partial [Candidatus Paceibacter sp.]|nr:hypothetical protein [Candidatus Paceibacter sp.]
MTAQLEAEARQIPKARSTAYLKTQALFIVSDEHKKNTKWQLGITREPTIVELVHQWVWSGANIRFYELWESGHAIELM